MLRILGRFEETLTAKGEMELAGIEQSPGNDSGDLKLSPSLSALAPRILKSLTQHVEPVLVLFLIPVACQVSNGNEGSAPYTNDAGRNQ